jgi:hypothetical protein
MAIRTRSLALYVADHGNNFNMMIPDDDIAVAARGWAAAGAGLDTGAKYCKPRHVDGVDGAGNHRKAIVGNVTADLWTGAATTFVVAGVTYNVIGYVGEKRTVFA